MNSLDNHLEAASGLRGPVEASTEPQRPIQSLRGLYRASETNTFKKTFLAVPAVQFRSNFVSSTRIKFMSNLDNNPEAARGLRGPIEAYAKPKGPKNQILNGWVDLLKIPSLGIN